MKLIIVIVVACGVLLCQGAPTHNSIVAVPAEELPLQDVNSVQFNVARVLDHTLSKITLADCIKYLSESLDRKMKPLVDGLGKFSLRNLLVDWNRRHHEILSKVQNKGEAIISDAHRKGSEFIKVAHNKKEEIISSVHDKGEGLLIKKKQIISSVQDKGEELLSKKKELIEKVHHTGEAFIGDVLDGAKKNIVGLTHELEVNIPHHDEAARRKRDTKELEALADLLEDAARIEDLNEIDTKMASDVDPHDVEAYLKPSKPVVALVESEYYSLSELARQLIQWVRQNLSLRRILRQPTVISA